MINNIELVINKLKEETNNNEYLIIRNKKINNINISIIYYEPLVSSIKISEYIIKSLNKLNNNLIYNIKNNIYNFKYKEIYTYNELVEYINRGFCILLLDGFNIGFALEVKNEPIRAVSTPETDKTVRGSKDAFIEDMQTNIGLVKKRIRNNNLWFKNITLGKYTRTSISILYINGITDKKLLKKIINRIKKIEIDGIFSSGELKNLIENESKSTFPTTMTTERPDTVAKSLLDGKISIIVDNCPYAIIIPAFLNDFFKTSEDDYGKSINVSFTRIIKYISFWISLLTPSIYISLITYNQEIVPLDLLISFASQRVGVPFPVFIEAFIMIIFFEILRESDLRTPNFTGSSLSIVGALILGQSAVNAGIVSPIMIIVVAITAISSLPFTEFELINSIRFYRFIFMIGATLMGTIGIVLSFIYFITKLASLYTYEKPYLIPYVPFYIDGIKNSIIKFPKKLLDKREKYLTKNIRREKV
jgi:spore germination protein KA